MAPPVVVDDLVAILAARARRGVAIPGRATAEDDDAVRSGAAGAKHDHVIGAARPLPDEADPLVVDAGRDAEDVRRPDSGGRPSLSLHGGGGAVVAARALRRASALCRRARGGSEFEPRAGGRLPPSEELAGGRACREDERREDCGPSPAARRRSSDGYRCRRLRPDRSPRLWKYLTRAFGQNRVDEHELGTDRPQVFEQRALDGVRPRRHPDSLTSRPAASGAGPQKPCRQGAALVGQYAPFAIATASNREWAPVARSTRRMWLRTVSVLRCSSLAIWVVDRPRSRSSST
jgi:hypothetical protein